MSDRSNKGTQRRDITVVVRAAAVAGMAGPVVFAGVLLALTLAQYDFTLGIGWRPLRDPSGAWPSGLALGPYGWAQVANFIVSGILLMIFASGLHLGTTDGRGIGPALLFAAGAAMALMGFKTDPIQSTGPRTLHNLIHDLAFALFVLALLPAFFFLWRRFREDTLWRGHARYTLVTGVLATLLLFLPGVAYYFFLAVVLVWISATGVKLWKSTSYIGSNTAYLRRPPR